MLAVILVNMAVTGFLLLVKKDFDALQPPTRQGTTLGAGEEYITTEELFRVVLAQEHPDFQAVSDIDRVDFRPEQRVHKVRSRHNHAEIQVDAVTGAVLSVDWRPSDLIERIHDGSFFADAVHDYAMPLAAVGLCFLALSGLYLWLAPIWRRRRRRRGR